MSTYGNNYYDWDTQSAAPVPGFSCDQGAFYFLGNGLCSFNFNSVAANEAKVGNKSVFVRGDHQINDDWSTYMSTSVSRVCSAVRLYSPRFTSWRMLCRVRAGPHSRRKCSPHAHSCGSVPTWKRIGESLRSNQERILRGARGFAQGSAWLTESWPPLAKLVSAATWA